MPSYIHRVSLPSPSRTSARLFLALYPYSVLPQASSCAIMRPALSYSNEQVSPSANRITDGFPPASPYWYCVRLPSASAVSVSLPIQS